MIQRPPPRAQKYRETHPHVAYNSHHLLIGAECVPHLACSASTLAATPGALQGFTPPQSAGEGFRVRGTLVLLPGPLR